VQNKIEHRNIVAYGGIKKNISGYTRNRMQNPTIKIVGEVGNGADDHYDDNDYDDSDVNVEGEHFSPSDEHRL
jgi:hypothetical protein